MMSALNITGKKERVLGKYMRQHYGPAFCPTQRSVSILAQGHTKVHTGSMPWIYEGGRKVMGSLATWGRLKPTPSKKRTCGGLS